MRRIILIAITWAATVTGCDRFPDLSVQVTANLDPGTQCQVTADQDQILLRGVYDLARYDVVPFSYIINPRIESYIFNNALEFQGAQGNLQITDFDITLRLPDGTVPDFGESLPNPYKETTSAVIPPSNAINGVSRGTASAIGVPASYIAPIFNAAVDAGFDSFIIDIRANGTTSGGFSQQSPTFSWPISFCSGCMGVECDPPLEVGDPQDGQSCLPGQDGYQWCSSIAEEDTGTTN